MDYYSVYIIFTAISCALAQSSNSANQEQWYKLPLIPGTPAVSETPASANNTTISDVNTRQEDTSKWTYIGITAGVIFLLIVQTIWFCLYMRKGKSSRNYNNLTMTTQATANSEGRYDVGPGRQSTPKSVEQIPSSNIYEHVDYLKSKENKPPLPPTSTMPTRNNRSRLPLPHEMTDEATRSATFTPQSTQELLNQWGRQVSTVPVRALMNFNLEARTPSRSPQLMRVPSPGVTPVNTHTLRETMKNNKSCKIYESLPDLREFKLPPRPAASPQPPLILTPPKPSYTPKGKQPRLIPGRETPPINKSRMPLPNENVWKGRETHSPIAAKPRIPPPNDSVRNVYPPKPKLPTTIFESKPNEPLLENRTYKHFQKTSNELMEKLKKRAEKNDAMSNEFMEKFKKESEMNMSNTGLPPHQTAGQRPKQTPHVIPTQRYADDSSDDEWNMEEIKPINLYYI